MTLSGSPPKKKKRIVAKIAELVSVNREKKVLIKKEKQESNPTTVKQKSPIKRIVPHSMPALDSGIDLDVIHSTCYDSFKASAKILSQMSNRIMNSCNKSCCTHQLYQNDGVPPTKSRNNNLLKCSTSVSLCNYRRLYVEDYMLLGFNERVVLVLPSKLISTKKSPYHHLLSSCKYQRFSFSNSSLSRDAFYAFEAYNCGWILILKQ